MRATLAGGGDSSRSLSAQIVEEFSSLFGVVVGGFTMKEKGLLYLRVSSHCVICLL